MSCQVVVDECCGGGESAPQWTATANHMWNSADKFCDVACARCGPDSTCSDMSVAQPHPRQTPKSTSVRLLRFPRRFVFSTRPATTVQVAISVTPFVAAHCGSL